MKPSTARRILLVFAKAPEPGRVKTRLARTLGEEEAARIYRALGSRVVDGVRGGPYRTVIYHDPPGARDLFAEWFGGEGLEFEAQPEGDLGSRLAEGFRWGFLEGDLVCAIGTDAPGVDRDRVEEAFGALSSEIGPALALGPATDGGYYLVALNRRIPEIFSGIPWSTSGVLKASLARAAALGVRTTLLPPLADVDRPEDVPEEFRHPSPH
ncbi:MAG: TIGR04282 family arsenosugar biosynthesis glycosyltransferase [Gemmatimonadota bacterium]